MEYLDGKDLGDYLKERGPLPLDEAAGIMAQACHGMIAAHDAGLIHRDLKPGNLFLAKENGGTVLKVLDFGITKLTKGPGDGQITLTQAVFGSPLYMPPESFKSAKQADARSDIWSLGVIFYEMLTGVTPFLADNALSVGFLVTREDFTPPSVKRPGIPRSVDVVISRALKKAPEERYQSVRELLAAMEVFMPRGRNDTMTVAQVRAPNEDDDPRTAQMKEGVTRMGMMKPGSFPSIPVGLPDGDVRSDVHDAPTRVASLSDPTEAPTRLAAPVVDDDELDAPTRMRSDTAEVMSRALGYKMVPIIAEPEGEDARTSTVGETGRIAGPVSMSTVPENGATPAKKLSPLVWALPAAAAVFGFVGWLVGRSPDGDPKTTARAAAPETTSTAEAKPVETAKPIETQVAASATAEPTDSSPTAAPTEEPAADASAAASPSAVASPTATQRRTTPAPTSTAKKKKKPFNPQSI
jgi:serine/threonine-protein kinase